MDFATRLEVCRMEILMIGSILLCALVGTLVGLKLLTIASRSHKLPELAIGVALLAYAGLSQPTLLVQQALGGEVSLALRMGIVLLRISAFYVTLLGLAVFTWQVFGAESRWRLALAAAVAVTALMACGVSIWRIWLQLGADLPQTMYRRIGVTPHYLFTFGWVSLESLRYYALMRRRRAVGLADPVVTNRFLVWGAGEAASTLVVLALFLATMTQPGISAADPFVSWCVTLAGLVNAFVWWLTFAPPETYLRWVRAGAAEGASDV